MLSLSYPLFHKVLFRFEKYNAIESSSKQLVVLHHSVEALVLSIATPIFSYYMLRVNFQEQELDQYISKMRSVAILMFTFTSMYMIEIASRYNNTNPLVLVHHIVATIDALFVVFFPTIVMFKTASVLEYFI